MSYPHDAFYRAAQLEQRTYLITGATSGIGEACATLFAAYGARLVLCGRDRNRLNALASTLTDTYSVSIQQLVFDVTHANEVMAQIHSLPADWEVDVVINSAGLAYGLDKLHEGNVDDWNAMIDTNVKGLLHVCKAVIPGMIARNRGHIVNLGSISSHDVYSGASVYCATKHATDAITRTLRMDLFGTDIRVTAIDPGAVETAFSVTRFRGDTQRAAAVYKGMHPLTGEDVAHAILYCIAAPPHVNVSQLMILPTDQISVSMVRRDR